MKIVKIFKAIIESDGGGAFVQIPFDVEEVFGKKRVPVIALIEGHSYRGNLSRWGGPDHILIILKAIRQKIGKDIGDLVEVKLEEDTLPRMVTIPPDLQEALDKDPEIRTVFQKLSYSHQKEHVNSILDAKRPDTRQRRISKTLEMLSEKLEKK
ncbi:YdeI/OmpD-associated family protein [Chloroflexota bacterium]